jgi:hypothetical protein
MPTSAKSRASFFLEKAIRMERNGDLIQVGPGPSGYKYFMSYATMLDFEQQCQRLRLAREVAPSNVAPLRSVKTGH